MFAGFLRLGIDVFLHSLPRCTNNEAPAGCAHQNDANSIKNLISILVKMQPHRA
jgi:hypothetical protein